MTNPYEFEVEGLSFLGTSGQNVEDVYKYSTQEDRLKILEAILDWGHLVPTAPDTLSSYPFAMDDPFLLEAAPNVLFAGNQPTFQTGVVTGEHSLFNTPIFDHLLYHLFQSMQGRSDCSGSDVTLQNIHKPLP